ncbi:hypothetical protein ODV97_11915 [Enterococcus gallinarum]|nr:hypothetical protein [Enterococcus gallinarum]
MTEKSSKLVVAVELLYVLVKCSLHFWGWLVTGGFIYGWVSSHKKLVFVSTIQKPYKKSSVD